MSPGSGISNVNMPSVLPHPSAVTPNLQALVVLQALVLSFVKYALVLAHHFCLALTAAITQPTLQPSPVDDLSIDSS